MVGPIGSRGGSPGSRGDFFGATDVSVGTREVSLGSTDVSVGSREDSLGSREDSIGTIDDSVILTESLSHFDGFFSSEDGLGALLLQNHEATRARSLVRHGLGPSGRRSGKVSKRNDFNELGHAFSSL